MEGEEGRLGTTRSGSELAGGEALETEVQDEDRDGVRKDGDSGTKD